MIDTRMVSVKQIVALAQDRMAYEDSRRTGMIRQYVWQGIRRLGFSFLNKRTETLDIQDDGTILRPKDYAMPIKIELMTPNGECIEPLYDANLLKCDCCKQSKCCKEQYKISENECGFYINRPALEKFSKARLTYFAFFMAKDGSWKVAEIYSEALVAYVVWRETARERTSQARKGRPTISLSDVQLAEQQYNSEARKLTGKLNRMSEQTKEILAEKFRSLV